MAKKESFGPELRVKKRRDFLRIQSTRRKVRSNTLLFALVLDEAGLRAAYDAAGPNTAPPAPRVPKNCRIGITVTTKVHKRAVRRNRLKRHLREVFRRDRRYLLADAEIVVIALEGSVDLDFQAVRSEFRFAMRKAGLLPYRQR